MTAWNDSGKKQDVQNEEKHFLNTKSQVVLCDYLIFHKKGFCPPDNIMVKALNIYPGTMPTSTPGILSAKMSETSNTRPKHCILLILLISSVLPSLRGQILEGLITDKNQLVNPKNHDQQLINRS